jgi:hypothetical protein
MSPNHGNNWHIVFMAINVKALLLESMMHEYMLMEHLFGKLPLHAMDWRPGEKMRSTRELLQYLSFIGSAMAELFINGGWSEKENFAKWQAHSQASRQRAPEQFIEAISLEKKKINDLVGPLTEADLERETGFVLGKRGPLASGLLDHTLKYLTAYRMQLFLYAKMNGAEISTANNWNGIDWKKPN